MTILSPVGYLSQGQESRLPDLQLTRTICGNATCELHGRALLKWPLHKNENWIDCCWGRVVNVMGDFTWGGEHTVQHADDVL